MTNSPLEDRIKSSLERSAQAIDAETAHLLKSIRNQALNQPEKSIWLSPFKLSFWAPAVGLAFCSIIAVMLLFPQIRNPSATATMDQTAMLELIENSEELEIVSDPGFYLWMDELKAQSV